MTMQTNQPIDVDPEMWLRVWAVVPRERGTYALVYHCLSPFLAQPGRLGTTLFSAGYWVYVGSAFGPGGLRARLGHHMRPSPHPHWHLDYIKDRLRLVAIWATTDVVKREHDWAAQLSMLKWASCPIAGFGATDCDCRSHLIHLRRRPSFDGFRRRVRSMTTRPGHLFNFVCT